MRRRRLSRGQSLTEFALILPILAMIMVGAADLGRAFYLKVTLTNAARVAAEYAMDPGQVLREKEGVANVWEGRYPGLTDPCGNGESGQVSCGRKRAALLARNMAVLEAKNANIALNDVAIDLPSNSSFYTGGGSWSTSGGTTLTFVPNTTYKFSVRAKFSPMTPGIRALFGGNDPTFTHTVWLRHNCAASNACTWS